MCKKVKSLCRYMGTAVSVGCKVDQKHPSAITEMIDNGEIEVPNA